MKLACILLLVAGVLYVLIQRGGKDRATKQERRAAGSSRRSGGEGNNHRAVSIDCRGGACAKAREIAGTRYLLGTTPQLPLAGCNRSACRCRYVHHADRRVDAGDRRLPYSLESNLYTATGERERRERFDRRVSDLTGTLEISG